MHWGLDQAQGEHRLADQHASGPRPARAAPKQAHRLAGQKPSSPRRRRATASISGEAATRASPIARPAGGSEASVGAAAGGREGRTGDMVVGPEGIANRNNYQS
jgi:hypothetical protein